MAILHGCSTVSIENRNVLPRWCGRASEHRNLRYIDFMSSSRVYKTSKLLSMFSVDLQNPLFTVVWKKRSAEVLTTSSQIYKAGKIR